LRFILHVYENFPFLSKRVGDWKNQQLLITLSSGEVRLYFLEIDLKNQIKTS
jgi:hypothetical protein